MEFFVVEITPTVVFTASLACCSSEEITGKIFGGEKIAARLQECMNIMDSFLLYGEITGRGIRRLFF